MAAILPYEPSFGDIGLFIDESVIGALNAIGAGKVTKYSDRLFDLNLVDIYEDKPQLTKQGNYILNKEGLRGTVYVANIMSGGHSFAKLGDYERATEEYRKTFGQSKSSVEEDEEN